MHPILQTAVADRTTEALQRATAEGWQIVARDAQGVQLRKSKQWSKGAVVLGCVLLIFWGFGLLVLLLAAIDYAIAKDRLAYVTAEQLARGEGPRREERKTSALAWGMAALLAIVVGLAVLGMVFA